MKATYRMALLLGLAAFAAGTTQAAAYEGPVEPGIHVMNNYGAMRIEVTGEARRLADDAGAADDRRIPPGARLGGADRYVPHPRPAGRLSRRLANSVGGILPAGVRHQDWKSPLEGQARKKPDRPCHAEHLQRPTRQRRGRCQWRQLRRHHHRGGCRRRTPRESVQRLRRIGATFLLRGPRRFPRGSCRRG